jgi:predicted ChrR family anti-sigma factor
VDAAELLPLAQSSLRTALARIAEFKPIRHPLPSPVPHEVEGLLQSGADLTLKIMAAVHRAFVEGSAPLQAPFIPDAILDMLPALETWDWRARGNGRIATLLDGGNGGPRLCLLVAPRGFQTPAHTHFGTEQMLVLDGLLEDGEAAYPTGHWVHFGEGSSHAPIVLNDECWCLIREEGAVRFTGPLGWLRNLLAA